MPYVNTKDQDPGSMGSDNLVINYREGTPGVKAERDGEGNITSEAVKATGGTCRCGCGEEVPAGSLYRPGHDARLKGKITRAAVAGAKVEVNGKAMTADKAAALENFAPKGTQYSIDLGLSRKAEQAKTAEQKQIERDNAKEIKAQEKAAKEAAKQAEEAVA